MTLIRAVFLAFLSVLPTMALAQAKGPLRIEITEGVIEPLPFAVPQFTAEGAAAGEFAVNISRVIAADLEGTGLFREISKDAFIEQNTPFGSSLAYSNWKPINAQAVVTGAISADASGKLVVKFRVFDVFSEAQLGEGLQFGGHHQQLAADGPQGGRCGLFADHRRGRVFR